MLQEKFMQTLHSNQQHMSVATCWETEQESHSQHVEREKKIFFHKMWIENYEGNRKGGLTRKKSWEKNERHFADMIRGCPIVEHGACNLYKISTSAWTSNKVRESEQGGKGEQV